MNVTNNYNLIRWGVSKFIRKINRGLKFGKSANPSTLCKEVNTDD